MIYVESDIVHASSRLEGWTLSCRFVEGVDDPEFPTEPHLACTGAYDCNDSTDETSDDDDDDDDDDDLTCPVPVPGPTILTGPIWSEYDVQFHIPYPHWAFSTAQAWYMLAELSQRELWLPLSPSFFFATALKESFMGCSNDLPELDLFQPGRIVRREHSYYDGCFQLESTTAWVELCRMFADEIDCERIGHPEVISSVNQDQSGRYNFASSAIIKSFYHTFAYSLIPRVLQLNDPNRWFSTALDPLIVAKSMAQLYNKGAFSGTIAGYLQSCHDTPVLECAHEPLEYTSQIMEYTVELEAEVAALNCYDETVKLADVDDYLDRILIVFRDKDEVSIRRAARAAFLSASNGNDRASFQKVALAVIKAISDNLPARLHCPATELREYYQATCPRPM